jgi:hypothetical protein
MMKVAQLKEEMRSNLPEDVKKSWFSIKLLPKLLHQGINPQPTTGFAPDSQWSGLKNVMIAWSSAQPTAL